MKAVATFRNLFPGQLAFILLASVVALPVFAQQGQSATGAQSTPSASVDQRLSPMASPSSSTSTPKEGFWGRVNPFACKKWVNNRVEPLLGQLNELDEVNAKNAHDIQDVDQRAQAGIRHAQSTADAANQSATAAGLQAQRAGVTAQGAASHVNALNQTVTGLDQYRQASEIEVEFRGSQPNLSPAARKQLDAFAAGLIGHQGFVLEIEGYSPLASTAGIQSSGRLAEAVKRYFVTEHEIPVYRVHTIALGNAPADGAEGSKPAKTGTVRIRLMENSLAAQEVAPPHGAASSSGAERP
jgi:outer membrane protein OmpA-like peptidoglycan-associated protein